MNKLILVFTIVTLFCNLATADCDWTKIVKNADGTYTYSSTLNLCVGNLVQDNATKAQQIADLTKAITLYKLTIQTDEERIQNWIATSTTLEKTVQDTDKYKKDNEYLAFGLGVLATFAAAELARSLNSH